MVDVFDELISKYLSAVSGTYAYSHLANILNRCRFFFGFIQMDRQISMPCDIKYRDIMAFCEEALAGLCKADFSMYKSTVMNLLSWMAEQQLCPTGFLMLDFLWDVQIRLLCWTVSLRKRPKKSGPLEPNAIKIFRWRNSIQPPWSSPGIWSSLDMPAQ